MRHFKKSRTREAPSFVSKVLTNSLLNLSGILVVLTHVMSLQQYLNKRYRFNALSDRQRSALTE